MTHRRVVRIALRFVRYLATMTADINPYSLSRFFSTRNLQFHSSGFQPALTSPSIIVSERIEFGRKLLR